LCNFGGIHHFREYGMKKLLLILPLLLIVNCEEESDDPTLLGTWTIVSGTIYPNSDCSGEEWDQSMSGTVTFTDTNAVATIYTTWTFDNFTDDTLFTEEDFEMLCIEEGGDYEEGTCILTLNESWDYTLDDSTYTETHYMADEAFSNCFEGDDEYGPCTTCGYYNHEEHAQGAYDCITCPEGYEIDVYFSDCTGYCVPTGTAENPISTSDCELPPLFNQFFGTVVVTENSATIQTIDETYSDYGNYYCEEMVLSR
tara:strand:- start:1451 stop:2215 length:765 start_codon:yes stop_codon:yes gene_type:complete